MDSENKNKELETKIKILESEHVSLKADSKVLKAANEELRQLNTKIKESAERFRSLSEAAFEGICIFEQEKIINVNDQLLNMLGYTKEELIGNSTLIIIAPEDRETVERKMLSGFEGTFEHLLLHKNGQKIPVEIQARIISSDKGKIRISAFHDISQRLKIETALRISEQKFRNIFDNSTDLIAISSLKDFHFIQVNQTAINISGFSPGEFDKMNFLDFLPPDYHALETIKYILKNGSSTSPVELELYKKDGTVLPVEMISSLIDFVDERVMLSIIRDISERKKLEKRIFETIIETEEKERGRIAADLHDEIGPLLSSMKMYLSSLAESKDKTKSDYIMDQLSLLVKEAISSAREISNALSPHLLNNHGLYAALKPIIDQLTEFITVSYKSNIEDIRFSTNIEIIYYRIIRELINNTLKHSKATLIDIKLSYNHNILKLSYSDNGVGFEYSVKSAKKDKDGIGLFNIVSRIKTINGQFSIETEKGKGFKFDLVTSTN